MNVNPVNKFLIFIECIIIFFLFPVLNNLQKQDAISQTYITEVVAEFTDNVRNHGYLSTNMYHTFVQKLDATGNIYNIEINHRHKMVIPLYDENLVFMNDYETTYVDTFENEIFDTLEAGNRYLFKQGDYITVKVYNRNSTLASKLRNLIGFGNYKGVEILGFSGGMIRDEVD